MKAVGIKNLKNELSRYLQMVRKGEVVLVLDRDEVVAEIHKPTTPVLGKISPWEAFLNEQERKGGVVRAKRIRSQSAEWLRTQAPWPAHLPDINFLDEIREDRF